MVADSVRKTTSDLLDRRALHSTARNCEPRTADCELGERVTPAPAARLLLVRVALSARAAMRGEREAA
jgi:hypothetical protein